MACFVCCSQQGVLVTSSFWLLIEASDLILTYAHQDQDMQMHSVIGLACHELEGILGITVTKGATASMYILLLQFLSFSWHCKL